MASRRQIAKKWYQIQAELAFLRDQILTIGVPKTGKIFHCGLVEAEMRLAARWQRKTALSSFTSRFFDEHLRVCACNSFTLASDDSVDPLAVRHHIDTVHAITVFLGVRR
jgi:hypothetical protein